MMMMMMMSPLPHEEKKDLTKEEGEPPSDINRQFLFSKASRNLRYESSWTLKRFLDDPDRAVQAISHLASCSLATKPDFMATVGW